MHPSITWGRAGGSDARPRKLVSPFSIAGTSAVPPTKARYFRVKLEPTAQPSPLPLGPEPQGPPVQPGKAIQFARIAFLTGARVNRFEAKAGFQATVAYRADEQSGRTGSDGA